MNNKFKVKLNAIDDIKKFVRAAQLYDCKIMCKNGGVNAASIMGMFTLDLSMPVDVEVITSNEDIVKEFKLDVRDFIVE